MKTESGLESHLNQFNFSHLGIIFLSVVFLLSVLFMKKGFSFTLFESNKQNTVAKVLKAEDFVALVNQESGLAGSMLALENSEKNSDQKLALVDPNFKGEGQVAGASITAEGEAMDLSDAESVLDSGTLDQIKINVSKKSGVEAIKNYAEQVLYAESDTDALSIMQNLAGEDKASLAVGKENLLNLISYLGQIEVPAELEKFHKFKIYFYGSLLTMTDVYLGNEDPEIMGTVSEMFFATTKRIENIKNTIFEKYGVQL